MTTRSMPAAARWKCSNPPMASWGAYELARHLAEKTLAKQHPKPQPATPNPAPGSME